MRCLALLVVAVVRGVASSSQYPLFFLGELVLFPTEELPLQIFEPRYQLLVARCLGDLAFASELARSGAAFVGDAEPCSFGIMYEGLGAEGLGPGARGVLATIDRESVEETDDVASPVAYRLTVRGASRFTLASEPFAERVEYDDDEAPALLHANVTTVDDERDDDSEGMAPPRWSQIKRRLKWLWGREAMIAITEATEERAPPRPLSARAFVLASMLPFDYALRCKLLAMTSGRDRWMLIADLLGDWLEVAKQRRLAEEASEAARPRAARLNPEL